MKKLFASSDKEKGEGLLPAAVVWGASQLASPVQDRLHSTKTEPEPVEMIGLTIGILRRRKRFSHAQFAQRIGCSVEEMLALEAGLLPEETLVRLLPAILREVGNNPQVIQVFVNQIKFA